MPLFTDLPSFGYYYSGTVSPYANHSSLGGSYSRSPYSSYTGYSRGYSPLLSPISESRSGGISRINSPKRLHLHTSPKYRVPKPIRINTADIDVSANKYRRERPVVPTIPESHIVYGTSTPKSTPVNAPQQDGPFMPRADPHEDDVANRSTIKRGRTVVRLSTMRSRSSGASDNSCGQTNWRRDVAEDVGSKEEKKVRKTPGEKLIEKHLIRDKEIANSKEALTPELEPEEEEIRECRSRAPSFHDICKDISSDKLYDDLNAGELRRIVERRKSEDKAMISPILEVPTEIVDVFKEDGTFHRRTTLKKLRKSTKAIFVPLPNTPVADQSVAFDINLNTENKQKDVKIPKITASVEVQNSEPTLRAVATEVEVETKCNKQKRKFFYKIVVEDVVIETKTKEDDVPLAKVSIDVPNNNAEVEKPNTKDVKINEEDHNANNLHTAPILYTKVSNTSSKNLMKELQNEDKATNKISKKLSRTENRASKVKALEDETDNFWNVIGSRESIYYNARRQRILEEQRNRLASEAIIPEVSDINYNIDSSKAIKQTENIEQINVNEKLIKKTNVDSVLPNSKLLIKNKKNDVTPHVTETRSATKPASAPKVISEKECDKMASPVIIPNLMSQKEPSDKFAFPTVTPKPTIQNQSKDKITSPVLEKRMVTKDVLKKPAITPKVISEKECAKIASPVITPNLLSQKEPSDKFAFPAVTPKPTAQNQPKDKITSPVLEKRTVTNDVLKKEKSVESDNKGDNDIPKVPETIILLKNSAAQTKPKSPEIQQEPAPKKSECIKIANKNLADNLLASIITSPKTSDELNVKDNNLVKHSINKDDKTILPAPKLADVQVEKDAANPKPRNKKYVKAKTLDLRKNDSEDIRKDLKPKMSIKGRKENETKQIDNWKKQNSEIDISKVRKSKSATHTEVEKEITIKAPSNPPSGFDLSENSHSNKIENVSSNEKKDVTKDTAKTPANVIKKPKPLLEKINTKLNEQVEVIESKFKKPLKSFTKSVKQINDESKLGQLDLNPKENVTTIVLNNVENLQSPALKVEEEQSKLEPVVDLQPEDQPPSEVLAQDLDISKTIKSKKSRKSPSLINSARQSLKTFSERVTEKVRNPSLRLVKKPAEESKPAPALVSMNTSSDLTAIAKEPVTPIEKKCKLIPKNEPAAKPLIATPRPLQTVVRNRKAQQLHRSVSSDTDDSSDSSWTDSSDEESDDSEFYECGSPLDNHDIAMDSLITTEPSYAYEQFLKTSRIIPPATKIPRFRKYGLDDFNFLKVLGKGSFGKVLLAELKNTEYYYAVKCLNKNIVLEDDDVECTLIERKVLALGTKHPYLCHLFCTFQTESHLFFVMEYLNGGDLMFHIQHSGRFPEPRAAFYAAEIVSGLRFLHKKGIVYRDLKLDNILLDFDGHVRIADFGMCKLQIYLDKTADTFCGTPDYMAPEIIKGLRYNQLVDWWSFGVLLYEMLIGQSPFSGCDEDELFWSICNEIPYYPKHLSNDALEILTRFLNKDSEVRLGSGTSPYGDVTEQRFFQDIDWGRLERRQLNPPFKPRVLHPLDTQYFDKAFTGEKARLTPIDEVVMRGMDQERFHGFSYTNPNATD